MPLHCEPISWDITLFCLQLFLLFLVLLLIPCIVFVRNTVISVDQRRPPQGRQWKLPPGPPTSPIVGNLLQMLESRADASRYSAYLLSLSQHGEMTTLRMGSVIWVLLNTSRVATEIIAKRGNVTGERPYLPIASGLVSRNRRTVLRETVQWAEGRRVMHHLLHGSALKTYGEWAEIESVHLLAEYCFRPHLWYSHHYRYSASIANRIVLGERLLKSSLELDNFRRVTIEFIVSINASIIDFFPQLVKLPKAFQPWRRHWEKMGQFHYDVFQTWWKPLKEAIANGTASPSFVRDALLHENTKYSGDDEEAMYLATSVIAAGSDNSRMTLNAFVMSALCHPNVMQKARDELDKVCGSNASRLPKLDDMVAMPYVCAMVKEVLRWRPVVPLIIQHQLTQDLDFEGYLFPKGTNFLINSIALNQEFDEPNDFNPDRWLNGNESSITHGLWQFGGGRRICVGYKIAQQELFIAFARLIYCFDYAAVKSSKAKIQDEKANQLICSQTGAVDSHRLRHDTMDEPFPVKITVRSKEHEQLIINAAAQMGFLESAKAGF